MKYLCKCNIFFCKNTSLLTGGSSTHKTSAGAWTGIVWCPDGHRPICEEIFESSRRLSDIVRCPAGYRTVPGRAPLTSYGIKFKQKSLGARPMCSNAGRAMSFYPRWPYQTPYGRRGILSSTLTSPGTVQCQKNDKKSYDSSCWTP